MDEISLRLLNKDIPVTVVRDDTTECDVDIIMPAYKERAMATWGARSFFKLEHELSMRMIFVDNSGSKEGYEGLDDYPHMVLSVPDIVFNLTKGAGKMSHSNAYALEVARIFCKAPYVFVCHNDVLAYKEGWLSYLRSKMEEHKLAAFLRDNIRINAAHVSGFMYDREFFAGTDATFWPRNKPLQDVGDNFSYYLQRRNMPYFVCPCSHNTPSLLKKIHKRSKKLKSITADKCLDDQGDVVYLHTGRGTVKMLGSYKKTNKTTYNEWLKFAKKVVGE